MTDPAMPGGDGIELIAAVRERTEHPVAIVAMTALGSSMRDASLNAGANAFLEKPVAPSELVRVLAEL